MRKRKQRIDRGIKARATGVFSLWSWQEMLYVSAPKLLPIIGMVLLPLVLGYYWQKVLLSVAIFGLLAISWDFLAQSGMISLGQALFFGIGSYLTGIMNYYWGWPLYVTIPLATLVGGLLGTLILLPILRLRGIFFAIVTMMLPLMLVRIIEATRIFGGTEGLDGLGSIPLKWGELYLVLAVLLICLFGFRRLMDSDFGLVLKAIRDNDQSVKSAGISINWYKIQALFIGSSIGAFAGAFMTHAYMFVGMPAFALDYSIMPIAATVVGGPGSFAGAVLGSFILVPLSELLRGFSGLRIAFYGMFLIIFTITLPEGLFHFVERKYHQFERWVEVEK